MQIWNRPDSIFAPIYAAVPPQTTWMGFKPALRNAVREIPVVKIVYDVNEKGKFLPQKRLWERMAVGITDADGTVALRDAPTGDRTFAPSNLIWRVRVVTPKAELLAPAVPGTYSCAALLVVETRSSDPGQVGGQQLAYLRYLWADTIRRASAQSVIFGGQHHWQDEWWQPNPPKPEGASTR